MVFKKCSKGFEVVYIDLDNKTIQPVLLSNLEKELENVKQKFEFKTGIGKETKIQ